MSNKVMDTDNLTLEVANEFIINLIYTLSDKYSISIDKVFDIFDEINYWRVVNDTEVCCVLAHDGVKATINELGEKFNDILSRNTTIL